MAPFVISNRHEQTQKLLQEYSMYTYEYHLTFLVCWKRILIILSECLLYLFQIYSRQVPVLELQWGAFPFPSQDLNP